MLLAMSGFVSLFILRLIKRHGWEYVPVVLVAFAASWYFGGLGSAGLADGVLFSAIAGVHLVTRRDIIADRAAEDR